MRRREIARGKSRKYPSKNLSHGSCKPDVCFHCDLRTRSRRRNSAFEREWALMAQELKRDIPRIVGRSFITKHYLRRYSVYFNVWWSQSPKGRSMPRNGVGVNTPSVFFSPMFHRFFQSESDLRVTFGPFSLVDLLSGWVSYYPFLHTPLPSTSLESCYYITFSKTTPRTLSHANFAICLSNKPISSHIIKYVGPTDCFQIKEKRF